MELISIDKDTYKIDTKNYYRSKFKKNQIIIAGSLRKENFHIKRLKHKRYGTTKEWCTYTISRDGTIYQHYDPKFYTDFMKNKEIDKHSISIMLENMGELVYDFAGDKYLNAIFYEECAETNVFEKNWKGYRYWEKYTEEQFYSLIDLCEYICEYIKIPLETMGFNIYHEETFKFNGIVTRSNYNPDFNDLNPSFNFKRFTNILVYGEDQ